MRGPFLRWTDEGFGRDCSGGRERNKFYRASLNLWVVRIELFGRVVIHWLNRATGEQSTFCQSESTILPCRAFCILSSMSWPPPILGCSSHTSFYKSLGEPILISCKISQ